MSGHAGIYDLVVNAKTGKGLETRNSAVDNHGTDY